MGVNEVTVLEMSEMQSLRNPSASIEHFNQGRHDVESVNSWYVMLSLLSVTAPQCPANKNNN